MGKLLELNMLVFYMFLAEVAVTACPLIPVSRFVKRCSLPFKCMAYINLTH